MSEDRRKYQVGSDNDTADTTRTTWAKEAALYLARSYKQTVWPRPLDLTYEIDGLVIEVRVRQKSNDDTIGE